MSKSKNQCKCGFQKNPKYPLCYKCYKFTQSPTRNCLKSRFPDSYLPLSKISAPYSGNLAAIRTEELLKRNNRLGALAKEFEERESLLKELEDF